jgi:GNAT superfamily N-acetyltransferase
MQAMPPKLTHLEFDKTNPIHLQTLAAIWNEASGQALSISVKFASHNIKPSRGGSQSGRFVLVDGEPAGVVLASLLHDEPSVMSPELGWIDVLAVRPAKQQQGLGATLLKWAEEWLQSEGCRGCVLGSSLRPFVPGVPIELNSPDYFTRRGYSKDDVVWDVAANLATYQPPSTVREIDGVVRPAQPGQEADLLGFLQREFAGRWRYECQEFLRDPHCRFSDYMLLWTARGVDGFCVLTFEDSGQPIERFYPYQLPRPWGQLGSVGVSADRRGQGYGAALLDAGLRRLHNNGVNGCVIDWTTIVDFYGKFGFTPYRAYQQMYKSL